MSQNNRIGQARMMSCGMTATIIEYRNANDIDVKFEDDCIRRCCSYDNFKRGTIKHPSKTAEQLALSRIGETRYMHCGLKAKIIAYRKADDIDIEFEDGVIIKGRRYCHFCEGTIAHPDVDDTYMSLQEFAIHYYLKKYGFRKIYQGEWEDRGFGRLELDFYSEEKNVAIEVDGGIHNKSGHYERDLRKNIACNTLGVVLYRFRDPSLPTISDTNSMNFILNANKRLSRSLIDCKEELETIFCNHNIKFKDDDIDFIRDETDIMTKYHDTCINYYEKKRVGESVFNPVAKQFMTVVAYRDSQHIDVQFEDGTIVTDRTYNNFKRANISHPLQTRESKTQSRIGEIKIMNNGMQATIVDYRKYSDIDIKFENGVKCCGVSYGLFKSGDIACPGYKKNKFTDERVGQVNTMNNGQKATIIKYINEKNIDVKFEDGTIVKRKAYSKFKKGSIANPNYDLVRVGEVNTMNSGHKAKIISYRKSSDMDIEFEDGAIRSNISYRHFKAGNVSHPNTELRNIAERRVGEVNSFSDGHQCKIIAYRSSKDIDIEFEDGTIRHGVQYKDFKNGKIKHPNRLPKSIAEQRLFESKLMNDGNMATIIRYKSATDIDVKFEDETVVQHRTYDNFKNGKIKKPDKNNAAH